MGVQNEFPGTILEEIYKLEVEMLCEEANSAASMASPSTSKAMQDA
jgi:hypothetical protein